MRLSTTYNVNQETGQPTPPSALTKTLSQSAKANTATSPVDQPIKDGRNIQNLYFGTGTSYMTYHLSAKQLQKARRTALNSILWH